MHTRTPVCDLECLCFERITLFAGVVSRCPCGRSYSLAATTIPPDPYDEEPLELEAPPARAASSDEPPATLPRAKILQAKRDRALAAEAASLSRRHGWRATEDDT